MNNQHSPCILFPSTREGSRDETILHDLWYPLKRSLVSRNAGERQTKISKAFHQHLSSECGSQKGDDLARDDCLSNLHIQHRREPNKAYKLDIVTFDSTPGMNVELDTSLAHLGDLSKKDGADAQRREESKRTRYGKKDFPEVLRSP